MISLPRRIPCMQAWGVNKNETEQLCALQARRIIKEKAPWLDNGPPLPDSAPPTATTFSAASSHWGDDASSAAAAESAPDLGSQRAAPAAAALPRPHALAPAGPGRPSRAEVHSMDMHELRAELLAALDKLDRIAAEAAAPL